MIVLKCTQERFEALHKFIKMLAEARATDIHQLHKQKLLEPIFEKMEKRIKARLNANKGWNISLTPLQASSYYTIFHGSYLGEGYKYESIIIDRHLEIIDRELSPELTSK